MDDVGQRVFSNEHHARDEGIEGKTEHGAARQEAKIPPFFYELC